MIDVTKVRDRRPRRPLAGLIALCGALAAAAGARASDESLAQAVPAEVSVYVELSRSDDLLISLTDPQLWSTLAELAGQPADPEDTQVWREQIRRTIQMEPTEAIRTLFSQRVAFASHGAGRSWDAIVLCRPRGDRSPTELMTLWQARPPATASASQPVVHELPGRLGVFEHAGNLIFGDLSGDARLLRQTVQRVERRAPGLADDATYRALLARVPENPDGVLFARLQEAAGLPLGIGSAPAGAAGSQPASAPLALRTISEQLPGPLRGATNVLLAMHRDGTRLHLTAVGDARPVTSRTRGEPRELVGTLPERTLAAWGTCIDAAQLLDGIDELPDRNVLRTALRFQQPTQAIERLVAALRPEACIAVGQAAPPNRLSGAPPIPAAALLVSTAEPTAVEQEVAGLVQSVVTVYNFLLLSRGLEPLPAPDELPIGRANVRVQDLTDLLDDTSRQLVGELQLCWTLDADTLIVATHIDWMRQILESRDGRTGSLWRLLRLPQRPVSPDSETIIVAQGGMLADLGSRWLSYVQRTWPAALDEDWWRTRQPGGSVRLGVDVSEEADQMRLRVTTVHSHSPSDGVLKVGDRIVGCNGRRFATSQPVREIRELVEQRPRARWVSLLIERDGVTLSPSLRVPFVDPIQSLRRLVAIGRVALRVVYYDESSPGSGAQGHLTIQLRSRHPAPAGEPAVQPVGAGDSRPAASEPSTQPTGPTPP